MINIIGVSIKISIMYHTKSKYWQAIQKNKSGKRSIGLLGFSIAFLGLLFNSFQTTAQLKEITYIVTVNCFTPEEETVVLHLERGYEFIPMTKISDNQWKVIVDLPKWWNTGTERYKYCRNYMAGGADEAWDGRPEGMREVTLNATTTINDVVNEWRWLPVDGIVPEINTSAYLANPPAKLPSSSFMCGTSLPDYWWEKSFSPVVHQTFDRIVKETNSNWVQYNPISAITQFTPTLKLDTGSVSSLYTSDKDLRKIIEGAHNRGLKVFLQPFTWSLVQDPSPGSHSISYWTEYEAQWRDIILYYARIAQEYQVEMLSFSVPDEFDSPAKIQFIDNLYQKLLADVRAVYKGSIAIPYSFETNYEIYNQCDYLFMKVWDWWPFKLSSSTTPTVSEMVQALNKGLNEKYKLAYEAHKKPIILNEIAASSYNGSVIESINWEEVLYWNPDDPAYPVDLQEQADAYEAMLQAISANEWIAGAFSFNYNHWNSLDKAPSVRFKPAEKVLAKWWRWIQPGLTHLTVSTEGKGSLDRSPASYVLDKESTITLTATPAAGYKLLEWTGDVSAEQATQNPLTIKMDADKNIRARFVQSNSVFNLESNNSEQIALLQNFPNPCSLVTTFQFEIEHESFVSLDIYTLLGEKIIDLLNERKLAGRYDQIWENINVEPGIYLYKLRVNPVNSSGTFSKSRLMMISN